jgi:hypothetical protein
MQVQMNMDRSYFISTASNQPETIATAAIQSDWRNLTKAPGSQCNQDNRRSDCEAPRSAPDDQAEL